MNSAKTATGLAVVLVISREKKMKYNVEGTTIELDDRHFLNRGAEAELYHLGNVVYKICNPGYMIPEMKIRELSVLDHPQIIRPEQIVQNQQGQPVGYTMKYVQNTYNLCEIFTKAFRNRWNVTPEMVLHLVREMQKTIHFIHRNKILIVDLNQLNFLISQDFQHVWFVDVNSYQTPSYPATVIMDSIRDRQNTTFSPGTDWFSFAVVSFQMLMGIHPYRGRHPRYLDLDGRMKANISILNPEVTYPKAACQPLTVLPANYLKWYEGVLEKGLRIPPPDDKQSAKKVIKPKQVVGSNNFEIRELKSWKGEAVRYYFQSGNEVVTREKEVIFNSKGYLVPQSVKAIAFCSGRPVAVFVERQILQLWDVENARIIPGNLWVDELMESDGRVYVRSRDKIVELNFTEFGATILSTMEAVAQVSELTTRCFDGCVIQNLYDNYYVSLFPNNKMHRRLVLPELSGYQVIDAKYENRVLMVIAAQQQTGHTDRFVFRFQKQWGGYEHEIVKDVTVSNLNFTVLDNGICIMINEEEKVEVFVNDPQASSKKIIDDPAVAADMELTHRGTETLFLQDNKLFSFAMRK